MLQKKKAPADILATKFATERLKDLKWGCQWGLAILCVQPTL